MFLGTKTILQSWSRTQATVALSSCEAELGSLVTAATEAVGIQSLLFEAGFGKLPIVIAIDSKAAHDSMKKLGPGKMKHVQLRWWFSRMLCGMESSKSDECQAKRAGLMF